nr:MAG TPA: hypothetical protein [Caudoviricetes sp.]
MRPHTREDTTEDTISHRGPLHRKTVLYIIRYSNKFICEIIFNK